MRILELFQGYLEEVGATVMANDSTAFAARVALPFHPMTETASLVVATEADLRAGFDDFQQTLRVQHVTDMIRLADSAVLLNENLISGRYVTHLLNSAHRVVPPIRSQMTLRRAHGVWQAASIANSLHNHRWPILMPDVSLDVADG